MTGPTIHDWLSLRAGNQRRRAESDAADRRLRDAEEMERIARTGDVPAARLESHKAAGGAV
jgi:hypothetical protein